MTHTTTDAAEARAREVLAQHVDGDQLFNENGLHIRSDQCVSAMIAFATAEAASGAGEREELAAFGASEAAGYRYPGANQAAERAAFCAGAAHAASLPPATDPAMADTGELVDMLSSVTMEEGVAVFEHSAEEIGIEVMEHYQAIRAALAAAPTIPATGHAATEGEG